MAINIVLGLVLVVFIIVVFVIAQRLLFPHQLFFKKVVLKTGDAIYFFRVETIKWLGSHCSLSAVIQECCPYKLVRSSAY